MVVALGALVLLAGCTAVSDPAPATPVDGPGVPDGERRAASVTAVVDGDTVKVRYDDGTTDDVRLVGIDAPETRGANYPDEFEGVPNTTAGRACLNEAGGDATTALTDRLLGASVDLVLDPDTDERDRYDRLLAHVALDGENVNYWLIDRGHARVYDSRFSQSESFFAAERAARADRRGLWDCSDPATPAADGGLRVRVQADAPGDDHENPNGELVVVENPGERAVAIGGWTMSDEGGHTYTFPENASIPAAGSVTLYSGSGTEEGTDYYWDDGAVWNNGGDAATLRAANGTVVAQTSY